MEILNRDPKPPTEIDDTIPDELERICLKCLSKSRPERYPNAAALARELRRWQHPRRWLVGPMLSALVSALAMLLVLWALWPRPTAPIAPGGRPTAGPTEVLDGEITVTIWNEQVPGRKRLPLDQAGAVPLRPGDQVRLQANLKSPAYAYVIWIDTEGHAIPMYPWLDGEWGKRPDREVPVTSVSLPHPADQGFPMKGPPGTEMLMLLARHEPLPSDLEIAELLRVVPPLPIANIDAALWFADGRLVERGEPSRAPDVKHPQQIADPLLRAQREIQERLGGHFVLSRSVCFANGVE
jgi:hypothetical protein